MNHSIFIKFLLYDVMVAQDGITYLGFFLKYMYILSEMIQLSCLEIGKHIIGFTVFMISSKTK